LCCSYWYCTDSFEPKFKEEANADCPKLTSERKNGGEEKKFKKGEAQIHQNKPLLGLLRTHTPGKKLGSKGSHKPKKT